MQPPELAPISGSWLCCTSYTFFSVIRIILPWRAQGLVANHYLAFWQRSQGCKNPAFTLALQKQTQFPYQNEWNYSEGSKLIKQEKKKSGTFKAEILTECPRVSEENISTAVNKQSVVKEPMPESMKAIAPSLSLKPFVCEITPEPQLAKVIILGTLPADQTHNSSTALSPRQQPDQLLWEKMEGAILLWTLQVHHPLAIQAGSKLDDLDLQIIYSSLVPPLTRKQLSSPSELPFY